MSQHYYRHHYYYFGTYLEAQSNQAHETVQHALIKQNVKQNGAEKCFTVAI